jgi:hypothetical protein
VTRGVKFGAREGSQAVTSPVGAQGLALDALSRRLCAVQAGWSRLSRVWRWVVAESVESVRRRVAEAYGLHPGEAWLAGEGEPQAPVILETVERGGPKDLMPGAREKLSRAELVQMYERARQTYGLKIDAEAMADLHRDQIRADDADDLARRIVLALSQQGGGR